MYIELCKLKVCVVFAKSTVQAMGIAALTIRRKIHAKNSGVNFYMMSYMQPFHMQICMYFYND